MTKYSNWLVWLLVKTHHTIAGLELLLSVACWKINHAVLKHLNLLCMCLLYYCSMTSMMWMTRPPFIFRFYILYYILRLRLSLSIYTFIFLCALFFVWAFVKFYLWITVFVCLCSKYANGTICDFGLMTLCRWWNSRWPLVHTSYRWLMINTKLRSHNTTYTCPTLFIKLTSSPWSRRIIQINHLRLWQLYIIMLNHI